MADVTTKSPIPTLASAPFDKANADVILRSADNVDFRVHKIVLALASPLFEDMFTLPQAASEDVKHGGATIPVIPCPENNRTLDHLLRLCYPVDDPVHVMPMEIRDVLSAAAKYQMQEAVSLMRTALLRLASIDPMAVYAVACDLSLDLVAERAARGFRSDPLDDYVPEMDHISAGAYYRLLQYRMASSPPAIFDFFGHDQNGPSSPGGLDRAAATAVPSPQAVLPIFSSKGEGDLILRSRDGTDFHGLERLLSLASSIPLSSWPREQKDCSDQFPPIIFLAEHTVVLSRLLQLIYPMTEPLVEDMAEVVALLEAAKKYQVQKVEEFARRKLMEKVGVHPLRVYLVAARFKWKREAKEAARLAVYQTCDVYVPEMEMAPAQAYRRFLEYREQCRRVVSECISEYVQPEKTQSPPSPFGDLAASLTSLLATVSQRGSEKSLFWNEKGYGDELWPKIFTAIQPTSASTETQNRLHHIVYSTPRWRKTQNTTPPTQLSGFLTDVDKLEDSIRDAITRIEFKLPT
ncbi:hypothetical protein BKA93DRAFT_926663 [Sparassis latifolia]